MENLIIIIFLYHIEDHNTRILTEASGGASLVEVLLHTPFVQQHFGLCYK